MSHCHVHGTEYDYQDGCPDCRRDNEILTLAPLAILNTLKNSEDSFNDRFKTLEENLKNPGDYKCPYCKFVTLKFDATRCPSCHGEPGDQYWRDIRKYEKECAERKRIQEKEWEERRVQEARKEEARKAKAKEEADILDRARQAAERKRICILAILAICLLGFLIFVFGRSGISINKNAPSQVAPTNGMPINGSVIQPRPDSNIYSPNRDKERGSSKAPKKRSLRDETRQFDDL